MTRTALLAALAISSSSAVLVSGCKKKSEPVDMDVAATKMAEFRDAMCACKDKACADRVKDEIAKWGTDMAKKSTDQQARPSEATIKTMTELATQYSDCMTKALGPAPGALLVDAAVPVDAYPSDLPPPPTNPNDATRSMREANVWVREHSRSAVGHIAAKYVDQDGLLDAEDGELEIHFGFDHSDDPKRRTGAPIKEPTFAEQCFGLTLKKGAWTRRNDISCGKTFRAPTCSLAEVWKRALAAKAPADAVAVITYQDIQAKPGWFFRITDPARGVDFMHIVVDDCPLAVETAPL